MKEHRIGGKHRQPSGGEVTYWAAFGELRDGDVAVYAVFSAPMWTHLGSVDLTLPPSDIPLTLQVRSSVLSYIDATEFGPGTQPGPRWIGWRGALL